LYNTLRLLKYPFYVLKPPVCIFTIANVENTTQFYCNQKLSKYTIAGWYTCYKTYTMKQKFTFFSVLFAMQVMHSLAQPLACSSSNCNTNTAINNCPAGSSTIVTSFTNPVQKSGNPCGTGLCVNSVWRFANIATSGSSTINAEIKIVSITNAIISNIDDNANAGVNVNYFAPRISPDVDLTSAGNRRGWVEFEIKFYDAATGNGYTNFKNLENLNFIHYDIDGNGNNTNWFREMGHIKQGTSATNPAIQAYTATELSSDNYTESGSLWKGFIGSVCERDDVSSCAEVAAQANFVAPQNTVYFRMGYDSKGNGNSAGQPTRQYGARFGCFQFPTTQNLPVTITNFTLSKQSGNKVNIAWQTASETNNAGFELQRSKNGATDFVTIGNIPSQAINGNSNLSLNYGFVDQPNYLGTMYYRLLQKDLNGRMAYSEIKPIKLGDLQTITVYPNPSKDGKIEVKVPAIMLDANVVLKTANGSILYNKKVQSNLFTINGLSKGFYYLSITDNFSGELITQKIIVQ
jgi:hypothetical protein